MFVGNCGCCGGPCTPWFTDNGEWAVLRRIPGDTIDSLQGLTWDDSEIWKSLFKNWEISQILFRYDKVSQDDAWILVARSKYDEMDRIKQNPSEFFNTHRWTVIASTKSWIYRPSSKWWPYHDVENPPDVNVPARIIIKDDTTGIVYVDELRLLRPGTPNCFRSKVEKEVIPPNQLSLYVYVLKSFMGFQKRDDFVDADREAYMTELYAINDPIALEIASKTPYEWDRINNVDIANHDYNYLIGNTYGSSFFPTWLNFAALPIGEIYKQFDWYSFGLGNFLGNWVYWDDSTYRFPPIDTEDRRWVNFTNTYAQKLSLAQEAVAYTLEVYGEDSNEYKKAVTDLEDIERIIDWGQRKREADSILLNEILPAIENWRHHFNDRLFLCRARYFNNREVNGRRNIYAEKGFSQFDDNKGYAIWTYEHQYDKVSGQFNLRVNAVNKQREEYFYRKYVPDFSNDQSFSLRDPPYSPLRCMFSNQFSNGLEIDGRLQIFVSAQFEGGGWDLVYFEQYDLASTEWWQNMIAQGRISAVGSAIADRPDLIYRANLIVPIYMDLGSDIYSGNVRIEIKTGEGIDVGTSLSCPVVGCLTSQVQGGLKDTQNREIRVKSYIKSVKVTVEAEDYNLDITQGYSMWRLSQTNWGGIDGYNPITYFFCPLGAEYEVQTPAATGGATLTFTKVGEKSWNSKYRWPGSKFNGTFELVRRPGQPNIFEHIIDPLDKHQISSGPRRTPTGVNACNGRDTWVNEREIPVYTQNAIYAYDDPDIIDEYCGVYMHAYGYWAVNDDIVESLTPKYDANAFQFRGPSCGNISLASFAYNRITLLGGANIVMGFPYSHYLYADMTSLKDIFFRDGGGAQVGTAWRNRPVDFNGTIISTNGWNVIGPFRGYSVPFAHHYINTDVLATRGDRFIRDYSGFYLGCKDGNYFDENYNDEVRDGWRQVYWAQQQAEYLNDVGYRDDPFPLRHNQYGFAALPLHAFAYDNNISPYRESDAVGYDQSAGRLGNCFDVWGNNSFPFRKIGDPILARRANASDVAYHEFPKMWNASRGWNARHAAGSWPVARTWGELYDKYVNETGNFMINCKRVEIVTAD